MTDQKLRTSALPGWRLGCAAVLCAVMSSPAAAARNRARAKNNGVGPCLTDNLCKAHYDEARKAYKEKRYDEAYKEYKAKTSVGEAPVAAASRGPQASAWDGNRSARLITSASLRRTPIRPDGDQGQRVHPEQVKGRHRR